ncbi:hypothetical protein [Phytohabitans aurantiacus]|jgi:hypothetical protein|uniref:Uncharacterized protein n=1 Tax=Phytohabitans aurantiacus TaxID=3016789 RepID=A0ABQ5R5Z9_9ACTN|nr:hypothetical protein [Phytohabitans aurantiacus]GLI02204.1 hypothetical protein Pa4123_74820 [Phytohabitans aurantiacus]
MAGEPWPSDEGLLAALQEALRAADAVPPEFLAAARAVAERASPPDPEDLKR